MIEIIKSFFSHPWASLFNHGSQLIFPVYQKFLVTKLRNKIREKERIRVVFVLYELGSWKTENLYLSMLNHHRFEPQLLLLPYASADYAFDIFKSYLEGKKYEYKTLKSNQTIQSELHPDILFYQKPYDGCVSLKNDYLYNLKSLLCHVEYSFRNRCLPSVSQSRFYYFLWQYYSENVKVKEELKKVFKNKGQNMVVTGLPVMDVLLKEKQEFISPWKNCCEKKRIIYAPHHTISAESFTSPSPIDYATFLQYADFMLDMVDKYKDKVQWAFKPHPLLKSKLYKIWGREKTDHYYSRWQELENCQISEGEYLGLFKHSDAMIHDCGSFKLEYLYTGNPVLYLIKEDQAFDYPNWQTQKALDLHYQAKTKVEIESFIQNVIEGKDELKSQRDAFVQQYLTPPYGKSACQNIINAILGVEEYSTSI